MAIILDGTAGLQSPGVTDTGNLSVAGTTTLTGGLTGTAINLTTNVTGTLPIANGGTGTTSTTFANLTTNVTGTLPIANGGTGLTSTPANGALDIGNGTGFTRTTLSAGTGITITNASGSITIAGSAQGPSIGLVRAISINCILP